VLVLLLEPLHRVHQVLKVVLPSMAQKCRALANTFLGLCGSFFVAFLNFCKSVKSTMIKYIRINIKYSVCLYVLYFFAFLIILQIKD